MAIDYDKLAQTAFRLVENAGRTADFYRIDQRPLDEDKPWLGPDPDPDNYLPDAQELGVPIVSVSPADGNLLGITTLDEDALKRVSKLLITAPGLTHTEDLSRMNYVVDEGVRHEIEFVEVLRPATTTVLYFVGVRR